MVLFVCKGRTGQEGTEVTRIVPMLVRPKLKGHERGKAGSKMRALGRCFLDWRESTLNATQPRGPKAARPLTPPPVWFVCACPHRSLRPCADPLLKTKKSKGHPYSHEVPRQHGRLGSGRQERGAVAAVRDLGPRGHAGGLGVQIQRRDHRADV